MATANVEIKGDPKDFLAALEKSKKKIKEVRGETSNMMGKNGKLVAGAAALGGAIGNAAGDAIMAAIKFGLSKSEVASRIMGGLTAGQSGLEFSDSMDALQDRAVRLGMRGAEANLFAAEQAANTVGGVGAEKFNMMLQKIEMKRNELLNGTEHTEFGDILDKLGMTADQGGDAVEFMQGFFDAISGLKEPDQIAALQAAGMETRSIAEARQLLADNKVIMATMQGVLSQGGGREQVQARIEQAAGVAGQRESYQVTEALELLKQTAENQKSLSELAKVQHNQAMQTAKAMNDAAEVVSTFQAWAAWVVDDLIARNVVGAFRKFNNFMESVDIIAEAAAVFDGQPRPKK